MALLAVPIVLYAVAVQVGVSRSGAAVDTLAPEATRAGSLAQRLELQLAELDEIAVHRLVVPAGLTRSGFPEDYNAKRREVQASLMELAAVAPSVPAYQQPLQDIDYAVGHYHALMRAAFAAADGEDPELAASLYGEAHGAMTETLVPEASALDHAASDALDARYDRHRSRAASGARLIWISWAVLVACLVAVQVLLAVTFRRVVNLALAVATLLTVVSGLAAITWLRSSSSHLASAHERALEAIHVLAEARTAAVSAWQAEGMLLLDPAGTRTEPESTAGATPTEGGFEAEVGKLFRVGSGQDLLATIQRGEAPDGAGGFLATVIDADVSEGSNQAATRALMALGGLLEADAEARRLVAADDLPAARAAYDRGDAFRELLGAIDQARTIDRETFTHHADEARGATGSLGRLNVVAAAAVLALCVLGLYERLREYRG
jgi:hypothetical protein